MKNFILIDHEPWTKWRKQLFYDLFFNAGLNLSVWDLSQWLYPGMKNPDELLDENYLTKVDSEEKFNELLKLCNPNNDIIVEEVFRIWNNRKIFKLLHDYGFSTIKIELYGNTTLREPFINKIKGLNKVDYSNFIINKVNQIRYKLYNKFHKLSPRASIVLSSNAIMTRDFALNHPDYDRFYFSQQERIIDGNYIVFCDIFFPFHPDQKFFFNIKTTPDGKNYHLLMTRYFDFLEEKYGMPVIIAAHPKANYRGNEFGERKIIKYHTESLVKYSSMVTMHHCNTISYAVLGDKPIAFVATNDYMSLPNLKRKFELLANITLGLNIYTIDSEDFKNNFKFEKIKKETRIRYIYNYLTSKDSEGEPNSVNLRRIITKLPNI